MDQHNLERTRKKPTVDRYMEDAADKATDKSVDRLRQLTAEANHAVDS